jgi:hypothetical protein
MLFPKYVLEDLSVGNGYGNSYGNFSNNTRAAPSELEVMLKDFMVKQTAFNRTVE